MNANNFTNKILFITLIVAIAIFLIATIYVVEVTASPPMPIGIAGKITVDGNLIADNYLVSIKNNNTEDTSYTYTKNGYFVLGVSGSDLDEIIVSISYDGNVYKNSTTVDVSKTTQWINISIDTGYTPPNPPSENERPVIVIPDTFKGNTSNAITFDASGCYDPDGYIEKYEWNIYDYPPFSKTGVSFTKSWYEPKTIVGTLTIYDNNMQSSSKSFSIIISENTDNGSDEDDSNNNDTSNNTIDITIPPVVNFTVEGTLEYNSTVYLNSTSYDPDGSITNYTWYVSGDILYGKNVIFTTSYSSEDYYWLPISLTVTDNDGIINQKEKTVKIANSNASTEEYNVTIKLTEDTVIAIKDENDNIIKQGYGKEFTYTLPAGHYIVVYAYNGEERSQDLSLDKDTEMTINLDGENNTSLGGVTAIFGIMLAVLIYGGRKWKRLS